MSRICCTLYPTIDHMSYFAEHGGVIAGHFSRRVTLSAKGVCTPWRATSTAQEVSTQPSLNSASFRSLHHIRLRFF